MRDSPLTAGVAAKTKKQRQQLDQHARNDEDFTDYTGLAADHIKVFGTEVCFTNEAAKNATCQRKRQEEGPAMAKRLRCLPGDPFRKLKFLTARAAAAAKWTGLSSELPTLKTLGATQHCFDSIIKLQQAGGGDDLPT